METIGESGPGGAWLTVDPTPAAANLSTTTGGSGAIDIARTMWQDYVLGMDATVDDDEANPISLPIYRILETLNVENWDLSAENWQRSLSGPLVRYGVGLLIGLAVVALWLIFFRVGSSRDDKMTAEKTSVLRRFMAMPFHFFPRVLANGCWWRERANPARLLSTTK